jgi:arylsulfate sulfotransferase
MTALKKSWFYVALLLTTACHQNEIDDLHRELNFERTKSSLLGLSQTENLITAIQQDASTHSYVFTFEDGTTLSVPQDYIIGLTEDRNAWNSTMVLSDSTEISLPSRGDLNIASESVTLDPFGRNPLAALVKVSMPVKGKFKVKVSGKTTGGIAIENTFDTYANYHEIPVLGLYQDYANSVELTFLDKNNNPRSSQVLIVQTAKLSSAPAVEILTNKYDDTYRGLYFPSQGGIGFDQRGEIRWRYTGDAQYMFTQLRNGNIIITSGMNLRQYHSPAFYEVTMMGEIVRKFNVPNYLHHEVTELPNGNLLVASNSTPVVFGDGNPEEDYIVEMDRTSGSIVKTWNLNNIIAPERKRLPSANGDDWCHLNAIYFDDHDNSIVFSSRSQSIMAKLDYVTGSLKWILGSHEEWTDSFKPYLFTPIDQNGQPIDPGKTDFWTYGQHSPKRLANGNIIVYDNGDYRGFYQNPSVPMGSYTRGLEYELNEQAKTVKIRWQYDNNKSLFTEFTGSISLTDSNGHVLGVPPNIMELSDTDALMFNAHVDVTSLYRGFRFYLY